MNARYRVFWNSDAPNPNWAIEIPTGDIDRTLSDSVRGPEQ